MLIKEKHKVIKRFISVILVVGHFISFSPVKDAFAFSAVGAGYRLSAGSLNEGGKDRLSAGNKLWQDTIGESCAGRTQSAGYVLNAGFIPMIQSTPPLQTQIIPNQLWKENESKPAAFDLDDYFSSEAGGLNYTVSGNNQIQVSIVSDTHLVSFSQARSWFGTEKIRWTVRDADNNSTQSNEITLQVEGVDNPPVLDYIPDISVDENAVVTITPHAVDLDGDTLSYSFTAPIGSDGRWQTDYQSAGIYTITVTAKDPGGLTDTQEVVVTVRNVNRPPVIKLIPEITVNEGNLVVVVPVVSDADNDAISIYYSNPLDTTGKWLTDYDDAGTYNIQVTASDGIDTVSETAKITVKNTNRAPQVDLSLSKYTVSPNEAITITISASDPDQDAMSFVLQKDGAAIASGSIAGIYTTTGLFSTLGDHNISVVVTDTGGLSASESKGVDCADPNANRETINAVIGDFNGDALTDLGLHDSSSGKWEICLSDKGVFRNAVDWLSGFGTSKDWWPMAGDFNGDGKTDIGVYNNTGGELKIGLSNGSGFIDSGTWLNFSGVSYSWQPCTGNFNGDKYTDFGLYNKDSGEVKVALGTGSGFAALTTWLSGFGTDYIAMSGDFNADGLSDLCLFKKSGGEFKTAFSNNKAFVEGTTWLTGFAVDKDALVSDFNNDGLTDAGYWDKSSSRWYSAISTGEKFVDKGVWLEGFGTGNDESATSGDFNGNGITDAACFDKDQLGINRWTIKLSTNKPADLLTEIDNGIGGKTQVSYTYAASADNQELPFPVYVASTISLVNTFPAERAATYTQNFSFSGGYYDAGEREFRGFAKVKVSDPITKNYTETYFYQGRPGQDGALKGQIDKIIAYDGNARQISQTLNTYAVKKTGPAERFLGFPALIETTSTVWEENGTYLSTKDRFTYDNLGNILEEKNEGDLSQTGDEKTALTTYSQAYQLGFNRPLEIQLKDKDGITVSKKTFAYDQKGNLIKETAWLNTQDAQPITQYAYDSFGNLITTTNAAANIVTTDYETDSYTYPEKVTNALGQSISYIYEPKFGLLKSITDANGLTCESTYDSLGRLTTSEVSAGLLGGGVATTLVTYAYPDFNTKITTNAIGLWTSEYIDGIARKYKTVSPGEDGDSTRQVVSEVFYNNRGLTEKESLAHYIPEEENQISYIKYEYDIRGRVKKTISDFPGISADAESSINYLSPLYTETTDPQGHKTGTLKDVHGNIIEVSEFTSDGVFKTKYEYDTQSNLVQTTDNQGNIAQIFYDSLGRKTKMLDPDMGTWTYEYDLAGNLVKQTDAKGQILKFKYDQLNRLIKKVSLRGAGDEAILASYLYDDPAKANCIGRLSKVSDQSGATEFFYDQLGREIKSIKEVTSFQSPVTSEKYEVKREYDILDRLTKLTYPDGEVVNYSYDTNSGLLESLRGGKGDEAISYVQDITYNASGQIKTIKYGNGVSTDYTYGQDLRLSRINTYGVTAGLPIGGAGQLQDLNYKFDKNGNLTMLTDNLRSNIRSFSYDDLDRLIRAENIPASGGGWTNFDYQYDSIANMTYKSDTGVMSYGEPVSGSEGERVRPHALTSAGGYTYKYDANGNMTQGKNKTFSYDRENRLTEVNENGIITSFVYDGDGGRVRKTTYGVAAGFPAGGVGSVETTYIGSLFEIETRIDTNNTRITTNKKHIFAGANRICSINSQTGTPANPQTYYYHSDHLGSSNVITDADGSQVQHCEYTPYGTLTCNEPANPQTRSPVNHYFTGKELDSTGLYFYGARYYDPEIGRFISADPTIQHPYDPQDLNRYSYCRNNPINYVDPTGLGWKSFWKKIFQPLISAVAAVVSVCLVPSFAPLVAQYGFVTVAGTSAVATAGATATLNTGEGRQFVNRFAHGFFDNVLGMSPGVAKFFGSMVSHTLLASAYYIGISSITMPASYSGPDYRLSENQNTDFLEYGKTELNQANRGGTGVNFIKTNEGTLNPKTTPLRSGSIASDTGWNQIPILGKVLNALGVRHVAALGNVNGVLVDSAQYSLWKPFKGVVFGMPWTGTCQQSAFNVLTATGIGPLEASCNVLSHGGISNIVSTSLYGVNAGFGVSGVITAEERRK